MTPSKSGYTFNPTSIDVIIADANATGKNFTGTLLTYSISGTITDGTNPILGVLVSATGGYSATTNASGMYTITGLVNGQYTLTPSKSGYTFNPTSRNVEINETDQTGQNFTGISTTVDLTGWKIQPYQNGSAKNSYTLNGVYEKGKYIVIVRNVANAAAWANYFTPVNDISNLSVTPQGYFNTGDNWQMNDTFDDRVDILNPLGQVVDTSGQQPANTHKRRNADGTWSTATSSNGTTGAPSTIAGYDEPIYVYEMGEAGDNTNFGDSYVANYALLYISGGTPPENTYSISGQVTLSGSGLSGVVVATNDDDTATTDGNGNYTISGLVDGNYTITPSKTGYTFSPTSTSVTISGANQTGKNFTATAVPTYSISGNINDGTNPISSVKVSVTGGINVYTDASGNYIVNGLLNGNYTLTPSKTGYTFNPTSRNVTISGANQTGQNFTGTVIPTYSVSGNITDGTDPLADVLVSATGGFSAITNASGNYTITGLADGNYTLTPSKPSYSFNPTSISITISGANQTGKNFIGTEQANPYAPPIGYYDAAIGLTGLTLKDALHEIIDNHTKLSYDGVWTALKDTDEDPNNTNNIITLYTMQSRPKADQAGNGDGNYLTGLWNREHVWAKSHGFPNESQPPYTDVHHLRPADVDLNSLRSNKDFDESDNPVAGTQCYNDSDSFEPPDAVKGDVARMMFYMAVRYNGDTSGEPDLELIDYDSPDSSPLFGILSTLLLWHQQDPVSEWEQRRNHRIYTNWQYNRNPFIDHPEWVSLIWGNP